METTVSIPFGSGTETKTDPKMLSPPKVVLLQDAIFTNIKRLTKRNGYTAMTTSLVGGGTWNSPTMVKSYRNELIMAAHTNTGSDNGQRLLSYSTTLGAWEDVGKYVSVGTSFDSISTLGGVVNSSSVVLNNIAVFTYDAPRAAISNSYSTYFSVIDIQTGNRLANDVNIFNNLGSNPSTRCVVLGGTNFAIFYATSSAIVMIPISVTAGASVVVGSPVIISASYQGPNGYDVVPTSTGGVVSFSSSTTNFRTVTIDTAGTITHTVNTAVGTNTIPQAITICVDPVNGNVWVYWYIQSSQQVYYAIYSSTLTVVLGATQLTNTLASVRQIAVYPFSTTQQYAYVSFYTTVTNTAIGTNPKVSLAYPTINVYSPNLSGSGGTTGSLGLFNFDIEGRPFLVNSRWYLPVIFISPTSSTCFVVDLTDIVGGLLERSAVSKFLQTRAEGIIGSLAGTQTDFFVRPIGFIGTPQILSSSQIYFGCGYQISQANSIAPVGPIEYNPKITTAVCGITFDFNSNDANQALVASDTLVLNGSIVSGYDGNISTELGFNTDPDGVVINAPTTGGNITSGTYTYYIVYSWPDANGNLHQSAPSLAYNVNFAGGTTTGESQITVMNPFLTQKPGPGNIGGGISYTVYRTFNGGTIGYNVGGPFLFDPTSRSGSFVDTLADANLTTAQPIYTQGQAILPNIAPPPSMIMWATNNRVWALDNENPETTFQYSKTASPGTGISFSTGQLEYLIDSRFGNVTGASPMDEKTVILKQKGAGYFIGDGATDAGTGSTLSNFQFVPSDTGCSNSKSVLLYPGGVFFRSTNNKGIYLFSRGVQIEYFGTDVNAYNNQDIQNAQFVGNRNQIRFLTSSGLSILYDYVMNQWSLFTNHQGLSADVFNGNYVYIRTDGSVYQEDQSGTYLDNGTPFAPLIQLSWIKATSIQGFERCRRVSLLGDFTTVNGGHGVQISAAYDFVPVFSAPVKYIFTTANQPYQYRERLSRQKCDAFQLQIQEIVTGASGEYIDFSDLGLEIMAKTGLNKLPGSRSVG